MKTFNDSKQLQVNIKFYFLLKKINQLNFSKNKLIKILIKINCKNINNFKLKIIEFIENDSKLKNQKINQLNCIFNKINDDFELNLFKLSIKLILLKFFLLKFKTKNNNNSINNEYKEDLLSLEYDQIQTINVYKNRIIKMLLLNDFFNKNFKKSLLNKEKEILNFYNELNLIFKNFKNIKIKEIFILIFLESLNQSIKSNAGSNFEWRIKQRLIQIGIKCKDIKKTRTNKDISTEFDFLFKLNNKIIGISAKRTLRERYRQFINTNETLKIDVMIQMTLGIDITQIKTELITNNGIFLFISEKIYKQNDYLKKNNFVYSFKDLNLNLLKSLINT